MIIAHRGKVGLATVHDEGFATYGVRTSSLSQLSSIFVLLAVRLDSEPNLDTCESRSEAIGLLFYRQIHCTYDQLAPDYLIVE